MTSRLLLILVAGLLVLPVPRLAAHDIPADVTVRAFVRPEGSQLHLAVRVPLVAMRDVLFPTRGPGYLDLANLDQRLRDAATLWIANGVALYEQDVPLPAPRVLAARVSLPSDRSFATYEEARAHLEGPPLPADTLLLLDQAQFDVLLEYPIGSDRSEFSIRSEFSRFGVRVLTVLRFLPPGGAVRPFEFRGDPGLVRLDPRWHHAALRFVALGFDHILDGIDHLMFLACLLIPFRRIRPLVLIVTAFTVAHSITLMASAFNAAPSGLWFPPFIETMIAVSIVYMALENIVLAAGTAAGDSAARLRRRWIITFCFGLVHGFGFSFALRETMQFAGSHLLTSLVAFNTGVELGQLAVLVVMVPAINLLFRHVVAERIGTIVLSGLVAHQAWHWMIDRGAEWMQFEWPAADPAFLASAVRWILAAWIAAGVVWFIRRQRTGTPGTRRT